MTPEWRSTVGVVVQIHKYDPGIKSCRLVVTFDALAQALFTILAMDRASRGTDVTDETLNYGFVEDTLNGSRDAYWPASHATYRTRSTAQPPRAEFAVLPRRLWKILPRGAF